MADFVVDTSVAIKWLIPEEYSDRSRALIGPPHRLHAPDLLLLETAAALTRRSRRHDIAPDQVRDLRGVMRAMPVFYHPTPGLLDAAVETSLMTSRGVHDCTYVVLADLIDATVITADERLVRGLVATPWERRVAWIGDARFAAGA